MAERAVRAQLVDSVQRLPSDTFFIGGLSASFCDGYVAYLRLVREISHEDVAIRTPELERAAARRISRLQSPFVYRMTQQLAEVFATIGLPQDYEDNRRLIAEAIDINTVITESVSNGGGHT